MDTSAPFTGVAGPRPWAPRSDAHPIAHRVVVEVQLLGSVRAGAAGGEPGVPRLRDDRPVLRQPAQYRAQRPMPPAHYEDEHQAH
jgi:hypothetical protein